MAGAKRIRIGAAMIALALMMLAGNAMAMTFRHTASIQGGQARRGVQDYRVAATAVAITGVNGNTLMLLRRPALDLELGRVGWWLRRA